MRIAHCIAIRFVAMGICTHNCYRDRDLYAHVCRLGLRGPLRLPMRFVVTVIGAASRLCEPDNKLARILEQRRDTPDNEKWSGRWESNPSEIRTRFPAG